MAKQIKVTLVKSPIGSPEKHRTCVKCLGLRRMHHSVVREDNPTVRGLINKIYYMLKIEEA